VDDGHRPRLAGTAGGHARGRGACAGFADAARPGRRDCSTRRPRRRYSHARRPHGTRRCHRRRIRRGRSRRSLARAP
jgi:hypothetical protein